MAPVSTPQGGPGPTRSAPPSAIRGAGLRRIRLRASWAMAVHAVVVAAVLWAIAGCGTVDLEGGAGGSTTTPPTVEYGWFSFNTLGSPDGTPVDAVERAGLQLPGDAKVQRVETQAFDGYAESYLFVFQLGPASAAAFCYQDGLGGARKVTTLPSAANLSMGNPRVTGNSRWCGSAAPNDPSWSRYVLINGGDPATVHLSLQRAAG